NITVSPSFSGDDTLCFAITTPVGSSGHSSFIVDNAAPQGPGSRFTTLLRVRTVDVTVNGSYFVPGATSVDLVPEDCYRNNGNSPAAAPVNAVLSLHDPLPISNITVSPSFSGDDTLCFAITTPVGSSGHSSFIVDN